MNLDQGGDMKLEEEESIGFRNRTNRLVGKGTMKAMKELKLSPKF